jgi:Secretion system C-terminal sorting domain
MKTILLIFLSILLAQSTSISQMTYVPDDKFEQALIDLGYDEGPLNDSVPTARIDTVTSLHVVNRNISDLTGIEDFLALENLNCYLNELTSLNLSNNTKLKGLNCTANSISSLDLTTNTKMKYLGCNENKLSTLDVSKNLVLETLFCRSNRLTSLDVSKNTKLELLRCGENSLTNLDVTKNPMLKYLHCFSNQLTNLDVSKNSILEELHCYENQLTNLDVSKNSILEELYCSSNQLTGLDVSKNTKLELLWCYKNKLESLSIKNGNNTIMNHLNSGYSVIITNNPYLICIEVDDSAASATYKYWRKDETAHYSEDCGYTDVKDYLLADTEISVFPNPANTSFEVQFELEDPKPVLLSLSDLLGNSVQVKEIPKQLNISENFVVSHLPAGVYFLQINIGSESISRKIIVE